RVTQLPHRHALHDQPEGDDQARGLHWREDVQPRCRGDQPEGKSREPRHQRGREGGKEEDREIERDGVHRASPPSRCVSQASRRWKPERSNASRGDQLLVLAVLSSAARSPLASLIASSFAQKCMKISRGCSVSMWLWIAVTSMPCSRSALITGFTSSPV